MGTPRRYLPNLKYGRATSLDHEKHDITLSQAVEDVATFVAEKVPDTNAEVNLFFKQYNKPARNTGVKVHGIDGENVLIKVTVSKGPVKTMYTALLRVVGFEANELYRLLSRQGSPVMIHALQDALDNHEAKNDKGNAPEVKQDQQDQQENQGKDEAVGSSKSHTTLANFMKDKDNVLILLHSLREYGVGIKGVSSKELSSMLEQAFEGTITISDPLFIPHCVSALSRSGYIKHPAMKDDHWMFDKSAYEVLGLEVPKRLLERPKKSKPKALGITRKPVVTHHPKVNGSAVAPPSGAKVFPTPEATIPFLSSGSSLAKLLGLKEALKAKTEERAGLEQRVGLVNSEIQLLERQVADMKVDTKELRSLKEMLEGLLSS